MILPFLIASFALAVLLYLNKTSKLLDKIGLSLFFGLVGMLTYYLAHHEGEIENVYFQADPLALLFLYVLGPIAAFATIHYVIYSDKRNETQLQRRTPHFGLVVFITSIIGAMLSTHVGMMWAFLEATTLSAAILINHDKSLLSLEATWKYIFVASMGIAMAFIGILFLNVAAERAHLHDLTFAEVSRAVKLMEPGWLQASFLLVVIGFSIKMGVAPLFNVDIDAKDEAPYPISALFSSGLMNVGFLAIFRFFSAFAGHSPELLNWMSNVLLVTGLLSIFFAAVYILKIKNYKRMFAYSSTEHAGLVMIALSMGGELGYYAAILHLVLHAFTKASLFFQIGQVTDVFGSKITSQVGTYFKLNTAGGLVLILSFLAVTALPPSGLFISELKIFQSLVNHGYWWLLVIIVILLSFIIFSIARHFLDLLFTPADDGNPGFPENVSPWESTTQYIMLALVFWVGFVRPPFVDRLIHDAISVLPL